MNRSKKYPWVPDFFIIGAMKCGTTTMHEVLARHPAIFIPRGEIFFYDIDDFEQHPDFFAYDGKAWRDFDFERNLEEYTAWYSGFFQAAKPGQLIGEDSTTYLASSRAAVRIAGFNPAAKLIVMLRDPASRTYSNYWHLVRYGRALHGFEDSLRLWPGSLIQRSLYHEQLSHYLRYFPRSSIHVVLLEELVAEPQRVIGDTCRFLGVDQDLPDDALSMHYNRGDAPRSLRLRLWRNRLLWRRDMDIFSDRLPPVSAVTARRQLSWWLGGALNRAHRWLNPTLRRPPPMNPGTRAFLNELFRRENQGLNALLDRDLGQWWYKGG
jgi:hypothetical protein